MQHCPKPIFNKINDLNFKSCKQFLPYFDKRKQFLKMKFFVNEQNVSVMFIENQCNIIITTVVCLDLNICHQDECSCSKHGLEVEHAKSNLKTQLSQIWVICQLLPFVRVGRFTSRALRAPKQGFIFHIDILAKDAP